MIRILFLFIFLNSCTSLYWKESKLTPEFFFSSSKKNVLYSRIHFSEKNSWNPLDGTSLKKNYTTHFKLGKILINKKLELTKTFEYESWILPESINFSDTDSFKISFLSGENKNEFGTEPREAIFYDLFTNKIINLSKEFKIAKPIDITMNSNQIAILSKKDNSYYLTIAEIDSKPLVNEDVLLKNYSWTTDGDSQLVWSKEGIYIKGFNSCILYKSKIQTKCDSTKDYKNSDLNPYFANYNWNKEQTEFSEIEFYK
jgi:hypothetical protein